MLLVPEEVLKADHWVLNLSSVGLEWVARVVLDNTVPAVIKQLQT